MAKKAADSPFIMEKIDEVVQIKIRPFEGIESSKHSSMSITAEVRRAKKDRRAKNDRRAEVRFIFSGVMGGSSLSQTEASIWIAALRGLMDEAVRVGATLKPPTASKAKTK